MTHLVRSCTLAVAVTGVALALGGWGIDKIYIYFFRRQAEQLAQRLEAMPDHEQALGVVRRLGLDEGVRRLARGEAAPDSEEARALLRRFAGEVGAASAFVMDSAGTVVAYLGGAGSALGRNLAHRPYCAAALRGAGNLYAAQGTRSGERGLYAAAPVLGAGGQVLGVVAAKVGFGAVDALLAAARGSFALVTPEGLVFASNVPGWRNRMAGQTRRDGLLQRAALRELPPALEEELLAGALVQTVACQDPAGPWRLVGLADAGGYLGPAGRAAVAGGGLLLALAAAWGWEWRRPRAAAAPGGKGVPVPDRAAAFWFPVRVARAPEGLAPASLRGARLLVVAAAPRRRALVEALRHGGLQVVEAQDGATAAAQAQGCALALVDAGLADLAGTAQALRGLSEGGGMPLLALAPPEGVERARALAAGLDGHLDGALDPATLWATLRRWIRFTPAATEPDPGRGASREGVCPPSPTVTKETAWRRPSCVYWCFYYPSS